MRMSWRDAGLNEQGFDQHGRCIVRVDPRYFRPAEVETLLGDASRARTKLGWAPRITFEELVAEMVREDFSLAKRDALLARHGYPQTARYA
jgi:GDPmannose 4,6-dehydratase